MKILHIHPSLASGGIEAMICALANEMSHGHSVSVCSIYKPKTEHLFWNKLNTYVQRYSLGKDRKGFSLKEVFNIYAFICKNEYDVVYLHGFIQYYLLSVFLLHKKTKFCYTVHSDAYKENVGWSKRLFPLKRFFFKNKWIIPITISHASKDSFTELYKCPSILIYNGISNPQVSLCPPEIINQVRYSEKTKVFIHPGRISSAKNQIVLCEVFNRLIKEGNDVVLLIAGANDDRSIFTKLEPYFSDRIMYIGLRSDIIDLMAYSDAMCLPSLWEGLPVALLEALAVGCIPICSPVGGIVNIIQNDYNGLLSNSSSENDYLIAVSKFLAKSKDELKYIKANCSKSFDNYNITETAQKYLQIVSSI